MTILNHSMETQWPTHNMTRVVHDGKVACLTLEYTTTFLYFDLLFLLWHGINILKRQYGKKQSHIDGKMRDQMFFNIEANVQSLVFRNRPHTLDYSQ